MSRAGIDTDTFSAHSTRSASVTAASERGVSIRQIMMQQVGVDCPHSKHFTIKQAMTDFSEMVLSGKKGTFTGDYFEQYTVIYAALQAHVFTNGITFP